MPSTADAAIMPSKIWQKQNGDSKIELEIRYITTPPKECHGTGCYNYYKVRLTAEKPARYSFYPANEFLRIKREFGSWPEIRSWLQRRELEDTIIAVLVDSDRRCPEPERPVAQMLFKLVEAIGETDKVFDR